MIRRTLPFLLVGVMAAGLSTPSFGQDQTAQPSQADRLKAAIAALQQRYQATTGQSLFSGSSDQTAAGVSGTPQTTPAPVSQRAASLVGKAQQAVAAAAQQTGVEPEAYDGKADGKVPIGYLGYGVTDIEVNSDYPGPWRGRLTMPIYSIDRQAILFPEGTTIVGAVVRISGPNEAINNRLGLLPQYLVWPDGHSFKIKQQSVLDALGVSGIADKVDYHIGETLAGIGAFTAVQSLPDIAKSTAGAASTITPGSSFLNQTSQAGTTLLQKYTELVPTVTIRAGTPIRIFFTAEMVNAPVWRAVDRFELTNVGAQEIAR